MPAAISFDSKRFGLKIRHSATVRTHSTLLQSDVIGDMPNSAQRLHWIVHSTSLASDSAATSIRTRRQVPASPGLSAVRSISRPLKNLVCRVSPSENYGSRERTSVHNSPPDEVSL